MEQPILIFDLDIRLLGFYVSLIGTLASGCIAAFAGWIAYQQARGKKPILLLQRINLDAKNAPPGFVRLKMTHQFWNRRAFAVRISGYRLAFDNKVIRRASGTEENYLVSERHVTSRAVAEVVEPGKPHSLTTEFLLKVSAIEDVLEPFTTRLDVFEPMGWWRKKKLWSRDVFHAAAEFDRSMKTKLRILIAKARTPKERRSEWIGEDGQLQEVAAVFDRWKRVFNSLIKRQDQTRG